MTKPDYYYGELTGSKYIRPLIDALVGTGMTKIERKRRIGDFVEMYFGNYISAKDGSFTLAKIKDIDYSQDSRNYKAIVVVSDKWFAVEMYDGCRVRSALWCVFRSGFEHHTDKLKRQKVEFKYGTLSVKIGMEDTYTDISFTVNISYKPKN